jgi:hypothetical protein
MLESIIWAMNTIAMKGRMTLKGHGKRSMPTWRATADEKAKGGHGADSGSSFATLPAYRGSDSPGAFVWAVSGC